MNTKTEEYTISGDTVPELLRSMDRTGPLGQRFQRHAGHTDWHVGYHYRYERGDQGCRTRPILAEVNLSYEMPHWANELAAGPSLQAEWNRFILALWVHERGHGEHGIQAGNDIKAKLEGLAPQAACETAAARAEAVAREILEQYADIDAEYDRQTEDGRTQGASLEVR